MRTLLLLRHAKSSWDDPSIGDFDRPLNERGLRAAPFMGALMRERGIQVDAIVSSPAVRAKMTAELVRDSLDPNLSIRFDEGIYDASTPTLVEIVRGLDDELDSALLIGHNPGLEDTARALTGQIFAMPTAALVVIDLEVDRWGEAAKLSGTIRELIRPKDAMKQGSGNTS